MGFGKSNFNKNSQFHKNFKLQTPKGGEQHTDNKFRLLPAKGSLADSGVWAKYWGTHFGYKGKDAQDQTKLRMQTFRCVEERDFRSGMTKVACPECDLIAQKKKQLENSKARLKAEGQSDEDIKVITGPAAEWIQNHNCDRKWHINAMNEAGEFGVLQISHKCKKDLDSVIDGLVKRGIDPLAPEQGVWFNFRRSGRGIEVTDKVEIVKTEIVIDGEVVEKTKLAPLTEDQITKALEVCPDLTDVVRILSVEQVKMLVESTGDPEEIDSIFKASEKRERSAPPLRTTSTGVKPSTQNLETAAAKPKEEPVATKPVETLKVEKPAEKVIETKTTTPAEEDEEAALLALQAKQLAELKAKKAAAAAKAATKPATTPPANTPKVPDGVDPSTLSDEAYAAMFDANAK